MPTSTGYRRNLTKRLEWMWILIYIHKYSYYMEIFQWQPTECSNIFMKSRRFLKRCWLNSLGLNVLSQRLSNTQQAFLLSRKRVHLPKSVKNFHPFLVVGMWKSKVVWAIIYFLSRVNLKQLFNILKFACLPFLEFGYRKNSCDFVQKCNYTQNS